MDYGTDYGTLKGAFARRYDAKRRLRQRRCNSGDAAGYPTEEMRHRTEEEERRRRRRRRKEGLARIHHKTTLRGSGIKE